MAIRFCEKNKLFTLETRRATYQMQVAQYGYLLHLYYGKRVEGNLSYLIRQAEHGFSGNPYEAGQDRSFSTDTLPQEYSCFGVGDYRSPSIAVRHPDGGSVIDLRYLSHEIKKGKPALEGLPAVYCTEEEGETLFITLQDAATKVLVELQYTVLEEYDVITRSSRIVNRTGEDILLDRALSCCLDFLQSDYDVISFYGRHTMERNVERTPLRHGKIVIDSVRGTSSHQQNPFLILCDPSADEQHGDCYGLSFVYSGNFAATAEIDQLGQTRLTMGIHPQGFCWKLAPEEAFQTPETVLCFSPNGLGELSRKYHKLYRTHLCRGEWKEKRRPVLINNWEATYFDFDDEKLLRIAADAAQLGVEMLVMDDGWFGARDDDLSGLGDWVVNPEKIRCGLSGLCERVNALGMKLGIWFEPEMVNEDSDLYRKHPDWCLQNPGRPGCRSRYQFVLDLSRKDVEDYLFQSVSSILSSANLEYVKWDMNRHLTNVWSAALPADRQGEVYHRYVLGLYSLMERLEQAFPHILFEGCSGGGGRFDAGMLYYTPQIWCSDDTDAVERIKIQYGTSFGYPISSVGSHVSAVPNHQTGRVTPIRMRAAVAMAGTFGYELDTNRLSNDEKEEIREQIAFYQTYWEVINLGDYYRLTNPWKQSDLAAWQFVSVDKTKSLVTFLSLAPKSNVAATYLKLCGLAPDKEYSVHMNGKDSGRYSGSSLLHAGLMLPPMPGDYAVLHIELEAQG